MKKTLIPAIMAIILFIGFSSAFAQIKHRFLANVENGDSLIYVDQVTPANSWAINLKPYGKNNDLQLIGLNRVMVTFQGQDSDYVGKAGFCIFDLANKGKLLQLDTGLTPYGHETSCQRLPNGHTRLFRNNWTNKAPDPVGVTWYDVDSAGKIVTKVCTWNDSAGTPVVGSRCVRQTTTGTYLFGRTNTPKGYVCEGDSTGKVLHEWAVPGITNSGNSGDIYKAVRLKNGDMLTSTGSSAPSILELSPADAVVKRHHCTGTDSTTNLPQFFGYFEILPNNDIIVCNWRGHTFGDTKTGYALIELDTNNKVVWNWRDPQNLFSIHKVLVLDSLDPQYMYYDVYGVQTKVVTTAGVLAPSRSMGMNRVNPGFMVMPGTASVVAPADARGFTAYSLTGKVLWRCRMDSPGQSQRIALPRALCSQVMVLRFMQ